MTSEGNLPPVCRECRHYQMDRCYHPKYQLFNPVSGEHAAYALRVRGEPTACGPAGRGWEPLPPGSHLDKHWFTYLVLGFIVVILLGLKL